MPPGYCIIFVGCLSQMADLKMSCWQCENLQCATNFARMLGQTDVFIQLRPFLRAATNFAHMDLQEDKLTNNVFCM